MVGGRYRLDERLGSGSHGEVWRAADLRLNQRPVALKRALSGASPATAGRIKKEAALLASVSHPNVVTVYDTVHDDDSDWIVMELVHGHTLAESRPLSADEVSRFGAQLAGALEAVHAVGILHRDIKPANVLLTEQGFAKLADFGISRDVHAAATLTGTGAITGTPGYVAPEVAKGGKFTVAADVFSLGATLYFALEGTSPFGEDNNHALLWKTVTEEVRESERAQQIPMLEQMLRKDPGRRPSPEQVRRELARQYGDPSVGAAHWSGRRLRQRTGVRVAAATAIVGLLAAATWIVLSGKGNQADTGILTGGDETTSDFIGDPTTVDPCALLDPEALAEYGNAVFDTDQGNFNRCNVIVNNGPSEINIELDIYRDTSPSPEGETEMVGLIGVVRGEEDMPEECDRTLILPDGEYIIELDAEQERNGTNDICAMADTAVDHALSVLDQGPIPRREGEPDPASLISVYACDLLDADALEQFPGVDATHPVVPYGGWECRWNSTTSETEVYVIFDRDQPLSEEDGEPMTFAGRPALMEGSAAWGEGTCKVSVMHRQGPSADGDGSTTAEIVQLIVLGEDESEEDLCDLAVGLAEPLAAALPQD